MGVDGGIEILPIVMSLLDLETTCQPVLWAERWALCWLHVREHRWEVLEEPGWLCRVWAESSKKKENLFCIC